MNYEKAHAELLKGKKIRRKEWEPLMHLRMIDGEIIAFRGEDTYFYKDCNILQSNGWMVVDGDDTEMSFIEGIEHLKMKKCIRQEAMGDAYIFIDKDQIAMCTPVEFDFMPTWKCLNSQDWEIIK